MADVGHVDENVLAKFAQKLAANEKKIRDRAVKKLRRWLIVRSNRGSFTEEELLKIWKGLHYCMWMADKALIHDELAETLARLLNCFPTLEESLCFFDVFLKTEAREWFNIDRLRLDKFLMLVRRMYRHMLMKLRQHDWQDTSISTLCAILSSGVIHATNEDFPDGLKLHFVDIYLEELEKLNSDKLIKVDCVHALLEPYCIMLSRLKNHIMMKHVVKNVFNHLVEKETKVVFEMEEVDEDEVQDNITKVLQVDYAALSDRLFELASNKECPGKARNAVFGLVKTFKNLSQGVLGDNNYNSDTEDSLDEQDYDQATKRLLQFDSNISSHNKKKRKKAMKDPSGANGLPRKKRKLDSPHRKGYVSEVLRKKQEVLHTDRIHYENSKINNPQGKATDKADKEILRVNEVNGSHQLNRKKITKAAKLNNKQHKNNVVGSKSDAKKVLDQQFSSHSVKAKLKSIGKVAASNSPNNVTPIAVFDADGSKEQVLSKKGKKRNASIEVVDVSVSPGESRTFKDSLQETPGVQNVIKSHKQLSNNKVQELVQTNSQKKQKKKGDGKGILHGANDEKINIEDSSSDFTILMVSPNDKPNASVELKASINKKQKKKQSMSPKQLSSETLSKVNGDVSPTELETPLNEKKKKKKKNRSPATSTPKFSVGNEEEEVEIWVPNKKYQGQYKEAFKRKAKESLNLESPSCENGNFIPRKKFATFDEMKKSPPAFVRKAIEKIAPHSEPRKKRKKEETLKTPRSDPGNRKTKKRVSFIMERNMSQDWKMFEESLNLSPALPFNPNVKPDQSILKSPATPELRGQKKKRKSPKGSSGKTTRAKAADFF